MKEYTVKIRSVGITSKEYICTGKATRATVAVKRALDIYLEGRSKVAFERAGIEIFVFAND